MSDMPRQAPMTYKQMIAELTAAGHKIRKPARRRATDDELADGTAKFVVDYLREELAPLVARLEHLEYRLKNIEDRGEVEHRGAWADGVIFVQGNMVTDKGGLWTCLKTATRARPGTSPDWRLIAKGKR